jgi:hypothetical protein
VELAAEIEEVFAALDERCHRPPRRSWDRQWSGQRRHSADPAPTTRNARPVARSGHSVGSDQGAPAPGNHARPRRTNGADPGGGGAH